MSVRYAPSPTGRLHVGNLRTAWVSREAARKLRLAWIVRFEDIDEPRVIAGAQESQLQDLRALGLEPDEIVVQSHRRMAHWKAFQRGVSEGQLYPCVCSRKEVQQALERLASAPHAATPLYDGRCRREPATVTTGSVGWRFRSSDPTGTRDFIVARTQGLDRGELPGVDFVPAYLWACAIDDLESRHRLLVRCVDLAPVASQQREIQQWLEPGTPLPAIFHTALVVTNDGARLEKRTRGVTLPECSERGIGPAELEKRFRDSFDRASLPAALSPGSVQGEARPQITLAELGL